MKFNQVIFATATLFYSYSCMGMEWELFDGIDTQSDEETILCLKPHARADKKTRQMMKRITGPWKNYDPHKAKIQFDPAIYEEIQNKYRQNSPTQTTIEFELLAKIAALNKKMEKEKEETAALRQKIDAESKKITALKEKCAQQKVSPSKSAKKRKRNKKKRTQIQPVQTTHNQIRNNTEQQNTIDEMHPILKKLLIKNNLQTESELKQKLKNYCLTADIPRLLGEINNAYFFAFCSECNTLEIHANSFSGDLTHLHNGQEVCVKVNLQ